MSDPKQTLVLLTLVIAVTLSSSLIVLTAAESFAQDNQTGTTNQTMGTNMTESSDEMETAGGISGLSRMQP